MPKASVTSASALWFLVGPFDSEETVQHLPIYTSPFLIGRRGFAAVVVLHGGFQCTR